MNNMAKQSTTQRGKVRAPMSCLYSVLAVSTGQAEMSKKIQKPKVSRVTLEHFTLFNLITNPTQTS